MDFFPKYSFKIGFLVQSGFILGLTVALIVKTIVCCVSHILRMEADFPETQCKPPSSPWVEWPGTGKKKR